MMSASPKAELKVFISHRDSVCDECKQQLGRRAWIHLVEGKGALCLSCADLDHLEFLPTGDAALTGRAKRLSKLYAIVLKWSQARKRYERQGLLVEEKALEEAEASCLADADRRAAQAARRTERAAEQDREYIARFAQAIRERYPDCPAGRETVIAEHACRKYSGRVGSSRDAKELGTRAIDLAVQAHVRHTETNYDELIGRGFERNEARGKVADRVKVVLDRWFCTV